MGFLDFIFPRTCFGCGRGESYICDKCLALVTEMNLFCPVCKKRAIDGMTHAKCKTKLGLDGIMSLWRYEGVVRKAILGFKYKFVEDAAEELARRVLDQIKAKNLVINSSILVPVPLHTSRERWRGFNQSESVGKFVAEVLGLDFEPNLLIRKESKKSQTELHKEDRIQNVRGVFALNQNYSLVPSAQYLIFDDVWTTGSTMREAAKVLKRAGIERVWGLTIAS